MGAVTVADSLGWLGPWEQRRGNCRVLDILSTYPRKVAGLWRLRRTHPSFLPWRCWRTRCIAPPGKVDARGLGRDGVERKGVRGKGVIKGSGTQGEVGSSRSWFPSECLDNLPYLPSALPHQSGFGPGANLIVYSFQDPSSG